MYKILSFDFFLDSEDVKNHRLNDTISINDYDVILLNHENVSSLWNYALTRQDGRKALYSTSGSDDLIRLFDQRSHEFTSFLKKGNIIISFLSPVQKILLEKIHSKEFAYSDNYTMLPQILRDIPNDFLEAETKELTITSEKHPFVKYISDFKNNLKPNVIIDITDMDASSVFAKNQNEKIIALSIMIGAGMIVFLPPPTEYKTNTFLETIQQCAHSFFTAEHRTPTPEWTEKFFMQGEDKLRNQLTDINQQLNKLQKSKDEMILQLQDISKWKELLFEKGNTLIQRVAEALQLLGFKTEQHPHDDFGQYLYAASPEGKIVIQTHSTDETTVPFSSLERLSHATDSFFKQNNSYPDAMLLVNQETTKRPELRNNPFDDKIKIAAQRKQFILKTTHELYQLLQKALENNDEKTKIELRKEFIG